MGGWGWRFGCRLETGLGVWVPLGVRVGGLMSLGAGVVGTGVTWGVIWRSGCHLGLGLEVLVSLGVGVGGVGVTWGLGLEVWVSLGSGIESSGATLGWGWRSGCRLG